MRVFDQITDFFTGDHPSKRKRIVDGRILNTPRQRHRSTPGTGPEKEILRLTDLLQHQDFQVQSLTQGTIPLGIDKKTRTLKQASYKKMTTGIIAGRRNHGKSIILQGHALLGLHAKRAGFNCKTILCDPHHNLPDATGTFFKPILHQFDETFLGMESLARGDHLQFFQDLHGQLQRYQETGFDESAPWYLIFMDEADLFLKAKNGKITYALLEHLVNLRKGRIFFLLSFADTTKSGAGGHGTSLVAAGSTVFCVNYDATRARRVLGDDARKAFNLPVGQAVVKIPDERATICWMPCVTEKDLLPFTKKEKP